MKPIIYKSTDTGAPQLTVTAGAMNAVIKACLVAGYGSKAAAGWEVVHEDLVTKKMAIRSTVPKSIKSVLLLNNATAGYAAVTAYIDWNSGTNTGVTQFGTGYFVNKWTLDTPGWVIVATDSFFYLFVQVDARYKGTRAMSAFGDALSFVPTQDYSVLLSSKGTGYNQVNTGYSRVATSENIDAVFPLSVFEKVSGVTEWGDKSLGDGLTSSLSIFSRFPMYMVRDGRPQPTLELPGMLMPFSDIRGYETDANGLESLSDQHPYNNPLLGMYQPFAGRIWLHTDDWG